MGSLAGQTREEQFKAHHTLASSQRGGRVLVSLLGQESRLEYLTLDHLTSPCLSVCLSCQWPASPAPLPQTW